MGFQHPFFAQFSECVLPIDMNKNSLKQKLLQLNLLVSNFLWTFFETNIELNIGNVFVFYNESND